VASYHEAVAKKVAPPTGVLLALLLRFQESADFQFGISPRTRRDYIQQITRIECEFGGFDEVIEKWSWLLPSPGAFLVAEQLTHFS
jgi:hypothetical protein